MSDSLGSTGYQLPTSGSSEFNAQSFLVESLLSKINTTTLVKVVAVTNAGTLDPVGFVDIIPLVNKLDGSGKALPNGIIYHCCYFRLQGGLNAVIIDPQVNDIGICCFADKDISSVQINKHTSNPGSYRRFDCSDGIYLGGVLNGLPTQIVQFNTAGINITSPIKVTVSAPDIALIGKTTHTGQVWMNGKRVDESHLHNNTQPGTGNSGVVV
jgi:hypothetical protein